MLRYLIIDKELLLEIEAVFCMKFLQYVALFHGKSWGKTFWSFFEDCVPHNVHTKEDFIGSRVFATTANKNRTLASQ